MNRITTELFESGANEVERVEGNLLYIKGHPVPHKGIPHVAALEAVNEAKHELKHLRPGRGALTDYTLYAYKILEPHHLPEEQMTEAARGVLEFATVFLKHLGFDLAISWKLARVFAAIIEYDQAYRFRLQDLVGETSARLLARRPIKELRRLLQLYMKRDHADQNKKMRKLVNLATLILLMPKYRRAYINTLNTVGIDRLKFDDNDKYWACLKQDYKYFGLSLEERLQLHHNYVRG